MTDSRTLRVAIIGDRGIPARYSGFSTLVENLAVRLVQDHGMDVTVYCRSHYYPERPAKYKGVSCVYLPAPNLKSFESIIHSGLSIAHAALRRFDVAFVVDPGNAPYSFPLNIARTPAVFHTDGLGWQRAKWSAMQQRYYRWSERICARLATWLVTDSRAMQMYYLEEYRTPSTFIPYSGSSDVPGHDVALVRAGVEPNDYYLVVARLEPENNVDLIIREYKQSNSKRPLVIVGGAQYASPYGDAILAEADERVICIGATYDPGELNYLYEHCYAYLHGHSVGGTNPSLLRAMAAGAACIPIDIVFHREVLGDDNAYFDPEGGHLASLVNELDRNAARVEQLGENARLRAETLYRWDAVADAYAELFRRVATAKRNSTPASELLRNQELYRPTETVSEE